MPKNRATVSRARDDRGGHHDHQHDGGHDEDGAPRACDVTKAIRRFDLGVHVCREREGGLSDPLAHFGEHERELGVGPGLGGP